MNTDFHHIDEINLQSDFKEDTKFNDVLSFNKYQDQVLKIERDNSSSQTHSDIEPCIRALEASSNALVIEADFNFDDMIIDKPLNCRNLPIYQQEDASLFDQSRRPFVLSQLTEDSKEDEESKTITHSVKNDQTYYLDERSKSISTHAANLFIPTQTGTLKLLKQQCASNNSQNTSQIVVRASGNETHGNNDSDIQNLILLQGGSFSQSDGQGSHLYSMSNSQDQIVSHLVSQPTLLNLQSQLHTPHIDEATRDNEAILNFQKIQFGGNSTTDIRNTRQPYVLDMRYIGPHHHQGHSTGSLDYIHQLQDLQRDQSQASSKYYLDTTPSKTMLNTRELQEEQLMAFGQNIRIEDGGNIKIHNESVTSQGSILSEQSLIYGIQSYESKSSLYQIDQQSKNKFLNALESEKNEANEPVQQIFLKEQSTIKELSFQNPFQGVSAAGSSITSSQYQTSSLPTNQQEIQINNIRKQETQNSFEHLVSMTNQPQSQVVDLYQQNQSSAKTQNIQSLEGHLDQNQSAKSLSGGQHLAYTEGTRVKTVESEKEMRYFNKFKSNSERHSTQEYSASGFQYQNQNNQLQQQVTNQLNQLEQLTFEESVKDDKAQRSSNLPLQQQVYFSRKQSQCKDGEINQLVLTGQENLATSFNYLYQEVTKYNDQSLSGFDLVIPRDLNLSAIPLQESQLRVRRDELSALSMNEKAVDQPRRQQIRIKIAPQQVESHKITANQQQVDHQQIEREVNSSISKTVLSQGSAFLQKSSNKNLPQDQNEQRPQSQNSLGGATLKSEHNFPFFQNFHQRVYSQYSQENEDVVTKRETIESDDQLQSKPSEVFSHESRSQDEKKILTELSQINKQLRDMRSGKVGNSQSQGTQFKQSTQNTYQSQKPPSKQNKQQTMQPMNQYASVDEILPQSSSPNPHPYPNRDSIGKSNRKKNQIIDKSSDKKSSNIKPRKDQSLEPRPQIKIDLSKKGNQRSPSNNITLKQSKIQDRSPTVNQIGEYLERPLSPQSQYLHDKRQIEILKQKMLLMGELQTYREEAQAEECLQDLIQKMQTLSMNASSDRTVTTNQDYQAKHNLKISRLVSLDEVVHPKGYSSSETETITTYNQKHSQAINHQNVFQKHNQPIESRVKEYLENNQFTKQQIDKGYESRSCQGNEDLNASFVILKNQNSSLKNYESGIQRHINFNDNSLIEGQQHEKDQHELRKNVIQNRNLIQINRQSCNNRSVQRQREEKSVSNFIKRQLQWLEKKNFKQLQNKEAIQEQREYKEKIDCTFKPKIKQIKGQTKSGYFYKLYNKLQVNNSNTQSPNCFKYMKRDQENHYQQEERVEDRLLQWNEKAINNLQNLKLELERENSKICTFYPNLTPKKNNNFEFSNSRKPLSANKARSKSVGPHFGGRNNFKDGIDHDSNNENDFAHSKKKNKFNMAKFYQRNLDWRNKAAFKKLQVIEERIRKEQNENTFKPQICKMSNAIHNKKIEFLKQSEFLGDGSLYYQANFFKEAQRIANQDRGENLARLSYDESDETRIKANEGNIYSESEVNTHLTSNFIQDREFDPEKSELEIMVERLSNQLAYHQHINNQKINVVSERYNRIPEHKNQSRLQSPSVNEIQKSPFDKYMNPRSHESHSKSQQRQSNDPHYYQGFQFAQEYENENLSTFDKHILHQEINDFNRRNDIEFDQETFSNRQKLKIEDLEPFNQKQGQMINKSSSQSSIKNQLYSQKETNSKQVNQTLRIDDEKQAHLSANSTGKFIQSEDYLTCLQETKNLLLHNYPELAQTNTNIEQVIAQIHYQLMNQQKRNQDQMVFNQTNKISTFSEDFKTAEDREILIQELQANNQQSDKISESIHFKRDKNVLSQKSLHYSQRSESKTHKGQSSSALQSNRKCSVNNKENKHNFSVISDNFKEGLNQSQGDPLKMTLFCESKRQGVFQDLQSTQLRLKETLKQCK